MRGQTSLFTENDRFELRINAQTKADAMKKAKHEGYSLSYLVKCFILGYLAGDIAGEQIIRSAKK